jgi:predicted NBD/HSP70 family sugar kinase
MYLGIDVGASKILFAVFDQSGKVVTEHKIKTPADYDGFKVVVADVLGSVLREYKFTHVCCAIPGWIDFNKGVLVAGGRIPWHNVPIKKDLVKLMPGIKVLVHNDAKLAGLSEAILLHKKYRKVLYITISTGIGGGIIINDVIDSDFADFEPGQMMFEHDGKTIKWEAFASGRSLKEKYGKLASEINDPAIWKEFASGVAQGFEELLATIQPDVIVIGGGAGAHFEKFKDFLVKDLQAIKNPMVPIPPLLKARRPEEAVIYGCYDYIKQNI